MKFYIEKPNSGCIQVAGVERCRFYFREPINVLVKCQDESIIMINWGFNNKSADPLNYNQFMQFVKESHDSFNDRLMTYLINTFDVTRRNDFFYTSETELDKRTTTGKHRYDWYLEYDLDNFLMIEKSIKDITREVYAPGQCFDSTYVDKFEWEK
mgnify:CR=1 FL=1